MWARNDQGVCAEFTSADPTDRYHPDMVWVGVPTALQPWADSTYVINDDGEVQPSSLDYIKEQAKARLAARRWQEETRGAALPGGRVPTGDRDKTLLAGARDKALEEIEAAIAAAVADGGAAEDGRAAGLAITHTLDMGGVPLTATNGQFIAMARAIGGHVQACFDRWGEVWRLLDAAEAWPDVVAVYAAEIDRIRNNEESGWPT